MRERLIVGCMSGTSMDGLDCALTRITGTGLEMEAALVRMVSRPYDDALRARLVALASGEPATPVAVLRLARELGELHADAVAELVAEDRVDFVCAHGQTVWHAGAESLSWQLFDPWPIVRRCGLPVCYDLRQADLIAGGRGAPLSPLADWVLFRGRAGLVVNLGGVLNMTALDEDVSGVEAADVCPCNLLLDGLAQRLLGKPFDDRGRVAAAGSIDDQVVAALAEAWPVHGPGEASLGREDVSHEALDAFVARWSAIGGADLLRSAIAYLVEALAEISEAYADPPLVLAGGGARHDCLVADLRACDPPIDILLSSDLGVPVDAREAMAWAVLGALSQDGVPVSLAGVTGATDPGVAGVWAGR